MKAVVTTGNGGFDRLVWSDLPVPRPGAGEVLLRVLAAGVNNTEINTRLGWYSESVTNGTNVAAETISPDKWFIALSEPVRHFVGQRLLTDVEIAAIEREPADDIGIEHVPLGLVAHPHADLRAHLEKTLAGQDLDRLAQHVAADAELGRELGFRRQAAGGGEIAAHDAQAELVDHHVGKRAAPRRVGLGLKCLHRWKTRI